MTDAPLQPDAYTMRTATALLNRDPHIDITERELLDWMLRNKWVKPSASGYRHYPTSGARAGGLLLTATERPSHGGVWTQVLVRPAGLRLLHTRLGGTAALDLRLPETTP